MLGGQPYLGSRSLGCPLHHRRRTTGFHRASHPATKCCLPCRFHPHRNAETCEDSSDQAATAKDPWEGAYMAHLLLQFWRLEAPDPGADLAGSWCGLPSWPEHSRLLTVSHVADSRPVGSLFGVSSYKGTNPTIGAPPLGLPSTLITSSRPHLQVRSPQGLCLQPWIWGYTSGHNG